MTTFSQPEELYGFVASLLIAGEDREAAKLLKSVSAYELHELRELASRIRSMSVDAAREERP